MSKKKDLPEKIDASGNIVQRQRFNGNKTDYSDLGIDGEERITYPADSFCQGPEYGFDEFH
jgi:hypothetical protein